MMLFNVVLSCFQNIHVGLVLAAFLGLQCRHLGYLAQVGVIDKIASDFLKRPYAYFSKLPDKYAKRLLLDEIRKHFYPFTPMLLR